MTSKLAVALGLQGGYLTNSVFLSLGLYDENVFENTFSFHVVFLSAIIGAILFGFKGDNEGRERSVFQLSIFSAALCAVMVIFSAESFFAWICYSCLAGVAGATLPLALCIATENYHFDYIEDQRKAISHILLARLIGGLALPFLISTVFYTISGSDLAVRALYLIGAIISMIPFLQKYEIVNEAQGLEMERLRLIIISHKKHQAKLIGIGASWFAYFGVFFASTAMTFASLADTVSSGESTFGIWSETIKVMGIAQFPAILFTYMKFQMFSIKQSQVAGFLFMTITISLYEWYGSSMDGFALEFVLFLVQASVCFGVILSLPFLSVESFPQSIRCSMIGICLGLGYLGAIIATNIFRVLYSSYGIGVSAIATAIFSVIGFVVSQFVIEEPSGLIAENEPKKDLKAGKKKKKGKKGKKGEATSEEDDGGEEEDIEAQIEDDESEYHVVGEDERDHANLLHYSNVRSNNLFGDSYQHQSKVKPKKEKPQSLNYPQIKEKLKAPNRTFDPYAQKPNPETPQYIVDASLLQQQQTPIQQQAERHQIQQQILEQHYAAAEKKQRAKEIEPEVNNMNPSFANSSDSINTPREIGGSAKSSGKASGKASSGKAKSKKSSKSAAPLQDDVLK